MDIDDLCLKFSTRWINVDEIEGFFDKPLGFQKIILLKILQIVSSICHDPGTASTEIRGVGIRHIKYRYFNLTVRTVPQIHDTPTQ